MNSIEEDPQSFFAPQILLKRWQDENMENEMIVSSNPFLKPEYIYLKRRAAESNAEPESNIVELNPEPNDIRIKLDSLPSNDVAEHPGLQSDQVTIDELKERSRIQRKASEPSNEPESNIELNPDSNAEPNDIRIKLDSLPSNDVAEPTGLQSDPVSIDERKERSERDAK
jgi:hypothetical protein